MAFGYEFVFELSKEEKTQRRHLLDLYATIAQWSVLLIFALFQVYFLLSWFTESRAHLERLKSPSERPQKLRGRSWIDSIQSSLRKFSWWAGTPVVEGWGTRAEWICGLAWTGWLLFLSFHRTGNGKNYVSRICHRRVDSSSKSLGQSGPCGQGVSVSVIPRRRLRCSRSLPF
jgi:hypothetical protein